MKIDTIKALFTYGIATIIIVGGFAFLYSYREADAGDVRLIVAGLMGAAAGFVFNSETGLRATRAAEARHD